MCNVPFVKFCSEMASKGIVADLNKGKKLDGENYNIWHCKIQYVLNEQEVLETLTHSLSKPAREALSNTNVILLPMKVGARRIYVCALQC